MAVYGGVTISGANYFELFSCALFRSKYYPKRLKQIFDVIGNEPIVTLRHNVYDDVVKMLRFQLF